MLDSLVLFFVFLELTIKQEKGKKTKNKTWIYLYFNVLSQWAGSFLALKQSQIMTFRQSLHISMRCELFKQRFILFQTDYFRGLKSYSNPWNTSKNTDKRNVIIIFDLLIILCQIYPVKARLGTIGGPGKTTAIHYILLFRYLFCK